MKEIIFCKSCGLIHENKKSLHKHYWYDHREWFINKSITDLDEFLQRVVERFMRRYKLKLVPDEIVQYLRIAIYTTIKEVYDPEKGFLENFSKASCNIFLKRLLQEYYYKRHTIHTNGVSIYSVVTTEDSPTFCDILQEKYTNPTQELEYNQLIALIMDSLDSTEQEIFEYLNDEYPFTQEDIAISLGYSQPWINSKVKSIRNKIKEVHKLYNK